MSKRYITLPGGRKCGLGEYVRSWKALKALPPETYVANWTWFEVRADSILKEIRYGVHDRINIRGRLAA